MSHTSYTAYFVRETVTTLMGCNICAERKEKDLLLHNFSGASCKVPQRPAGGNVCFDAATMLRRCILYCILSLKMRAEGSIKILQRFYNKSRTNVNIVSKGQPTCRSDIKKNDPIKDSQSFLNFAARHIKSRKHHRIITVCIQYGFTSTTSKGCIPGDSWQEQNQKGLEQDQLILE